MRLQLCTWQEVESYLTRSKGIIMPVGSTEQHGPNGLIGTDAICPETVANGVAEQIEAMVGPTLSIGMAQHPTFAPTERRRVLPLDILPAKEQRFCTHAARVPQRLPRR